MVPLISGKIPIAPIIIYVLIENALLRLPFHFVTAKVQIERSKSALDRLRSEETREGWGRRRRGGGGGGAMVQTLTPMTSSPWIPKVCGFHKRIHLSLSPPLRYWGSSLLGRADFTNRNSLLLIAVMRAQSKRSWSGRWNRSRRSRAAAGGCVSDSRFIQSAIRMRKILSVA